MYFLLYERLCSKFFLSHLVMAAFLLQKREQYLDRFCFGINGFLHIKQRRVGIVK